MAGKVKVTESLINVVSVDEPKRLTGCEAQAKSGNALDTPTSTLGYADETVRGG